MAIPSYQMMMHPLLQQLSDNNIHTQKDLLTFIISHFNLTEEEINEMLPSGRQTYIKNRLGWAITYMKKA
ncbi:winged helix-turn-helix domain-containing protein [Priestia taiwanensis]|uniref:Restriction system protein Mrr-like N-terminal domain-containing protein n=1 Tax=Priestia taiwanensis TaxID=1347902 RepID=A0A917APG8_9BACI|nr:winged helix-turn-helix domain-containing protein [Priestia taiwanensis]MBM7362355.1 restriction endonuclease Mrr [Priestia taiwanensis]GGE61479.1 hypothetical protein GCM10007140_09770 [Priestia taiwanensis]